MNGSSRDTRIHRLRLGPIVGHTDHESTRIWIRVSDDPSLYQLRVQGRGTFDFLPTEPGGLEFGTAIAVADGLRSDTVYRYQVLRRRRVLSDGRGTFRTMPHPHSMAEVLFGVVSCNHNVDAGAWPQLDTFIRDAAPRFLLFIGDQVYLDSEEPNVWRDFLTADAESRRAAMAEKYQESWSRPYVRSVLANVPTYMIWDDHEIRDGWGSFAGDSPTLAAQNPRSAPITDLYRQYFEDARDVYWHFQACRNPLPDYVVPQAPPGYRRAVPVVFRCGRLLVTMLDSRGDRDVFRAERPVLGAEQWTYLEKVLGEIDPQIDALAVVTAVPIVCASPDGQWQTLVGERTDDIDAYRRGNREQLERVRNENSEDFVHLLLSGAAAAARSRFGGDANWGSFKVNDIDDTRDQWSHHYSRPEQEALIRAAVAARLTNRTQGTPRSLIFIGGDLHVGGTLDLEIEMETPVIVPCLVASGISKAAGTKQLLGTVFDQEFEVASGIIARLKTTVGAYNYGVVQTVPTGHGAAILGVVVHEGNASSWGLEASAVV